MSLLYDLKRKLGITGKNQGDPTTAKPQFDNGIACGTADLTAAELEAFLLGADTSSVVTGITAHAGGGQGSATVLTGKINQVTVIASDADSVKLDTARAGDRILVINDDASGSNTLAVFPASGAYINALSQNASVTVPYRTNMMFTAIDATHWISSGMPMTLAEAGFLNGVTAGTAAASKAVVLDSSKNIALIHQLAAEIIKAGQNGTLGALQVFAPGNNLGHAAIGCANQAGNTENLLQFETAAAARTWHIRDSFADADLAKWRGTIAGPATNAVGGAAGDLAQDSGNSKPYICVTAHATAATWLALT